jgi:hypothetical protein
MGCSLRRCRTDTSGSCSSASSSAGVKDVTTVEGAHAKRFSESRVAPKPFRIVLEAARVRRARHPGRSLETGDARGAFLFRPRSPSSSPATSKSLTEAIGWVASLRPKLVRRQSNNVVLVADRQKSRVQEGHDLGHRATSSDHPAKFPVGHPRIPWGYVLSFHPSRLFNVLMNVRQPFLIGFGLLSFAVISMSAGSEDAIARRWEGRDYLQRGSIIYRENWERGGLDTSQWGAQCNNLTQTSSRRGSFTANQNVVAQGRWAARFDLPADPTKATACEVIHNRTLDLDTDDYYALDVFFPTNWREPGNMPKAFWGVAIAQLNYQMIHGGPLILAAHRNYVNLVVSTGYFNGSTLRWYSGNGIARGNLPSMYAIPRPLKLGVWHQLIVHVRWSSGMDGAIDVWHRTRGQRRWDKTVRFRARPTVQWSAANPASTSMRTWDKIGAYRGQSSFPISFWNDGFCRASTFRAAKSCL